MISLQTRPSISLLCIASFLACVEMGSPAHAQNPGPFQRNTLGIVHLNNNHVARLSFHLPIIEHPSIGILDSSQPPVEVQLRFVDRNGNALVDSDGNPMVPPDSVLVRRGETISLDLPGYDLASASGRLVGVRAEVAIFDQAARGFASLEVTDTVSARRFVLYDRRHAWYVGGGIFAEPVVTACLGPVSLLSSETARLSVMLEDPLHNSGGEVGLVLSNGSFILAKDVVMLGASTPSGVLEFTAPHPDFPGTMGCVRITNGATAHSTLATLEIFDRDGNTVTTLDWSLPKPGPGKHGGGGWGADPKPGE